MAALLTAQKVFVMASIALWVLELRAYSAYISASLYKIYVGTSPSAQAG
jgi:hypothetical protein